MDTVKITFVNGSFRIITNTDYEFIRDCISRGENFTITGMTSSKSVTYVTSNILTVETEEN